MWHVPTSQRPSMQLRPGEQSAWSAQRSPEIAGRQVPLLHCVSPQHSKLPAHGSKAPLQHWVEASELSLARHAVAGSQQLSTLLLHPNARSSQVAGSGRCPQCPPRQ